MIISEKSTTTNAFFQIGDIEVKISKNDEFIKFYDYGSWQPKSLDFITTDYKKGRELIETLRKIAWEEFLRKELESYNNKKTAWEVDWEVTVSSLMNMVKNISEKSIPTESDNPVKEPMSNIPLDIQIDYSKYGKNIKYNTHKKEDRLTSIEFTYDKKRYKVSFNYTTDSIERDEDIKYSKESISSLRLDKFFEKAKVAFKWGRSPYYHGTEKIPHLEKFVYREVNKYINKQDK